MEIKKREQNKIDTKRQILDASLDLFSELGLENTSINDIVAKAGIARGTFYNYYKTTTEIFAEILNDLNNDINQNLKKAQKNSTNLYDFLYVSSLAYFEMMSSEKLALFHKNNQNHIRSISYSSASILSIVETLQNDLEAFEEINFQNKEYYTLLSFTTVSAASELFIGLHQNYFKVTNEEMAIFLANLLTYGLAGKPIKA